MRSARAGTQKRPQSDWKKWRGTGNGLHLASTDPWHQGKRVRLALYSGKRVKASVGISWLRTVINCGPRKAAVADIRGRKKTLLSFLSSSHILDLPSEILLKIFALLPTYHIMHSIANVCKRFRIISEDSSLQPLEYERKILKLLQAGQPDGQKDMAASLKRWPRNLKTAAAEDGKLTKDSVAAAKPKTVISGARESSALTPSTQILQRHENLCLGSSNNDEKGYLATKKRGINSVCQNVSSNDELIGLDC